MAASAVRPKGLSFNQVIDSGLYRINYLVYKFISKHVVAKHKKEKAIAQNTLRIVKSRGGAFYTYKISKYCKEIYQ